MAKLRLQSLLSTKILKALEEAGYTIRPSKSCLLDKGWRSRDPDWNASHTEKGVRIAINQTVGNTLAGVRMQVKLRTDIGTFKVGAEAQIDEDPNQPNGVIYQHTISGQSHYHFQQATESAFLKWLNDLQGLDAVRQLKSKADLEPLNFRTEILKVKGKEVVVGGFIGECECADIVAINNKLQVSQEGITTPGEECWFFIKGRNRDNYRFDIIVNAEMTRFHVVTNRDTQKFKGWQVTNNHKPDNGRVDFTTFTVLDQQAVRLAIENYLERHHIAA